MARLWGAVLLALLLAGCHGALVSALNERRVTSCVYWSNPLTGIRGVSATGGMDLQTCLAVPCMPHR